MNASQGQLGTAGLTTFAKETLEFKVPQLKNAYQKVDSIVDSMWPSSGAPGIRGSVPLSASRWSFASRELTHQSDGALLRPACSQTLCSIYYVYSEPI